MIPAATLLAACLLGATAGLCSSADNHVAGTRRVPPANVAGTRRVPSAVFASVDGRHTACACYIAGDPSTSVRQAGQALGHWREYAWYDSSADDLRPLKVKPPPPPSSWNWSIGPWMRTLFTWLAWTALAAVLGLVAWLLYRAGRSAEPISPAAEVRSETAEERRRIEALSLPVREKPADFLAEAARCYQAGNYREAIIYFFGHQLLELDRHQLIRMTRGKTNRQYLGEIGRLAGLQRLLEQTMVAFENVFFGNHPLHRDRFEACWSQQDRFDALVRESTTP